MSTFTSNTIYERIGQLFSQITGVYTAFIKHTTFFFTRLNSNNTVDTTIDAIINTSGDIYLLSNNNTIYINNNNLCIIHGKNIPDVNNYAIGSMFILISTGDMYILQIKNNVINWYKVITS